MIFYLMAKLDIFEFDLTTSLLTLSGEIEHKNVLFRQ